MTDKKIIHELKANDFFLDPPKDNMSLDLMHDPRPWLPIEECPRDGRTFEVICPDDRVYVVALIGGRLVGSDGYPGAPMFWRERS